MDLSEMSFEEIKALRNTVIQELADLKDELQIVKKTLRTSEDACLLEDLKTYRRSTYNIVPSNKFSYNNKHNNNSLQRQKLNLYSFFTGMKINSVLINSDTDTYDCDSDTQWFSYTVNANIEKLNCEYKYITNKTLEASDEDHKNTIKFKALDIKVLNSDHRLEFQSASNFFASNPSYFGSSILCLKKFHRLCEVRRNVIKVIFVNYKDYIQVALQNETGNFIITCKGKLCSSDIFLFTWSLIWDDSIFSMRDSFHIQVKTADDQLLTEVKPSFYKLCDCVICETLTEDEKYQILNHVMLAVRDADSRLQFQSSSSSISEQVNSN